MILNLEDPADLPGQQPLGGGSDRPAHPVGLTVIGPEYDADLSLLATDGEETLHIGDEVFGVHTEQGIADGLEDRALAGTVGSGEDINPGGEGQLRVAVGLDVFEVY